MKWNKCALISLIFLAVSCSVGKDRDQQDFILSEKDLIPEGVAFDPASQIIYVSSTYKSKIVAIDKEGKVSNFIQEGQDDIKSVIGMEVDTKTRSLWVISSEAKEVLPLKVPGNEEWRSSVYQFGLADGKLIRKFSFNKDSVFLNDITVGPDGTVYATETMQHAVYKVVPGGDSLQLLVDLAPYSFVNGICFADQPGSLFVSCTEGIVRIDLATKKFSLLPSAPGINPADIDGLSFTRNYFIGHQGKKLCRFYLNAAKDSLTRSDILSTGKEFDSSTTGEIGEGYYYFIVNSQIQSGIDYTKREIKPSDSLSPVIIRKIKLLP